MTTQIFKSPPQSVTLPKKLALEATFLPEIKAYFKIIRTDFETVYKSTGDTINITQYDDITLSMIKKQYKRVASVFKNDLRGEKKQETQEDTENDFINSALVYFILLNSKISADLIQQTNAKNITEAIGKARVALFEKGIEPTNKAIAEEASKTLKKTFKGRAETIAISETQYMAESAKHIEGNVLAGEQPFDEFPYVETAVIGIAVSKATKTWQTTLDEKTRLAHARADGQTVNLTQPYTVDNELLKYPRDTSLGASPKNVINCRCESQIEIIRNLLN